MQQKMRGQILAWTIAWEGSIMLTRIQAKKQITPRYCVVVAVSNTKKHLLDKLQEIAQCGHVQKGRKRRKETYSQDWIWVVTKREDLKEFLSLILPYLPAKKEQAEIALQFVTRRLELTKESWRGRWHRGVSSYTEEDEQVYKKMKELNRTGGSR